MGSTQSNPDTGDMCTQSNYRDIATTHLSIVWNIDWHQRVLHGSVTHTLEAKKDGVKEVVLDAANLEIASAAVLVDKHQVPAQFTLGTEHPVMGRALSVPLPSALKTGETVEVTVAYKTHPDCMALQWLDEAQTSSGKMALFSQCQPIYARYLAPVQDSPSVKLTYEAKIASVLPVLMSAIRQSPPSEGPPHDGKEIGKDMVTYTYSQPVPIPSYLIAIASGNFHYRAFNVPEGKTWKTGVWAEPELLERAHWEFSEDTPRFLAKEEEIVGEYRFKVYDILVMPPSFPYGGMENPCLTFATPTLLTGDRSLVDVIVHELTHSWFGNGITHAHAEHFWLNEGWTTYMERTLQLKLHGSEAYRGFAFKGGLKGLKEDCDLYAKRGNTRYQQLQILYEKGENPDDAYGQVPYEKGSNLILHLEGVLGGPEAFEPYVRDYVKTYTGKSITTEEWQAHLYGYWSKNGGAEMTKKLDSIDWKGWLKGEIADYNKNSNSKETQLFPVQMQYDETLLLEAKALGDRWDQSRSLDIEKLDFKTADIDTLTSTQRTAFLEYLLTKDPLPDTHTKHLGELYGLSTTLNAENRLVFYQVALLGASSTAQTQQPSAYAQQTARHALDWIVGKENGVLVGRMKFCRPIFRRAKAVDPALAREVFDRHKEQFHPIARDLISKDLAAP
ncbi:hypothetical protein CONPUDRAFT_94541 [Coniophora puteana RWD-64-598 SS2]|uniref:Peptidase M1 leukotriene A4 hydrolase/aminopeptidase C-terminal domain-containing protein n=1 Tax=Coniophora puteana (strain RWD-64-598) TaxID=741705 RepID=A0A5M3N5V9_CONPW|nr:uncharacterized protein CONPUDRAFT_94541 [Coniophora puteana RWD-64-598 SS2]EIW86245.1 hypothetical protein CONPUDRAFT_94541 [Coniophora puteana RWD-64-598 SS2]